MFQRRKYPSPPRELAFLIKDFRNSMPWIDAFRFFLTQNLSAQHVTLLDFVLDSQRLLEIQSQHEDKKIRELLKEIYEKYFLANCPKPVVMTNAEAREKICQNLSKVACRSTNDQDLKFVLDLIREGSRDFSVWKGGLEPAYQEFITTRPAPVTAHLTAVILSIL